MMAGTAIGKISGMFARLPGTGVEFRRRIDARFDAIAYLHPEALAPEKTASDLHAQLHGAGCQVIERDARRRCVRIRFRDDTIASMSGELCRGALRELSPKPGRYVIDYCDPNATKALHIGHLRNVVLGRAFAGMLRWCNAPVRTQSILCDIGRSVAETMAGYRNHYRGQTPQSLGCKSDSFVGKCYAAYLRSIPATAHSAQAGDEPLAREIADCCDDADAIIKSWLNGEDCRRSEWKAIVEWAQSGQLETLAAFGAAPDELIKESDSLTLIPPLVESGARSGLLAEDESKRIVHLTAMKEYAVLTLTRSDGFPTEHMRAFALWEKMFRSAHPETKWIHVIGDEWADSTKARIALHRLYGEHAAIARYRPVFHGMVYYENSKMKSSDGRVILIDEIIDRLASDARIRLVSGDDTQAARTMARLLITLFFLEQSPVRPLSFSYDRLFSEKGSVAWSIVQCYARYCSPEQLVLAGSSNGCVGEVERLIVCRSLEIEHVVDKCLGKHTFEPLVSYLGSISLAILRAKPESRYEPVVSSFFRTVLSALTAIP